MEDKNRFSFISTQGFAERLRRRRLGLGLRKQDLAAQVGVSLTTIQQYENGQLPKGEFAVRLGAALRCSLDWLLAGQGNDVARETKTTTRIIDRSNIFALDGQKAVFPFE